MPPGRSGGSARETDPFPAPSRRFINTSTRSRPFILNTRLARGEGHPEPKRRISTPTKERFFGTSTITNRASPGRRGFRPSRRKTPKVFGRSTVDHANQITSLPSEKPSCGTLKSPDFQQLTRNVIGIRAREKEECRRNRLGRYDFALAPTDAELLAPKFGQCLGHTRVGRG